MTTTLPLTNLHDLAEVLGKMPPGDAPAAWWASTHPDVLAGWERYTEALLEWQAAWQELREITGLPRGTKMMTHGDQVRGLIPPSGVKPPPNMRLNAAGYLVPRKRTRAERHSRVSELFDLLSPMPKAINFLVGIPSAAYIGEAVYPVVARKPAEAVLAFIGHDPTEDPQFIVDGRWTALKVSTFMLLRERGE